MSGIKSMKSIQDRAKHEQLIRDGYCVFENILDNNFLQQLRAITDQWVDRQTEEDKRHNRSTGSMIPTWKEPFIARLIAHPKALEALASIGFPEPKFSSGYIISKPAQSPPLFWHHDYAAWDDPAGFDEMPQQLFLMYYLVDTTAHNGCLRVIPGTHVHDNPLHVELEDAHDPKLKEAENLNLPAFSVRKDEVDVTVRAGDLVVGDSRLLHASQANQSNERRTVITLWYHPDMAALAEPVQAYIEGMSIGYAEQLEGKKPDIWPEWAIQTVEPLLARYKGDAEPLAYNRKRPMRGL
ncbi:phytanoyl-CoA dioxygenase family protein [Paenibacillus montanisoli]|uniref:Phytanoyl-CoA dioxygenase n=1 Tax=Paenibacillus montanisoli TaxID=2081970 RepID=A0A328U939_9BACL|nr:phytanoyl-CoA dioxygenase family protein [Paenibacillus montanisoli]RAP76566.1 phytanoyl-CoA dioxygenase [Paenibacillus montanisoli]